MTVVPTLDLSSAEPHPNHAPANIEAEQALLGAVLFDNAAYERLSDQLQSRHFYEPFHQRLFAAMEEYIRKGQLAEPQPVIEEVQASLDAWMLERLRKNQPEVIWRRLLRVAGQLDQNSRRRELRALLAGELPAEVRIVAALTGPALPWTALWDVEHGPRWRHLVELRGRINPATEPISNVVLLAQATRAEGDFAGAESILKQAVAARPLPLQDH